MRVRARSDTATRYRINYSFVWYANDGIPINYCCVNVDCVNVTRKFIELHFNNVCQWEFTDMSHGSEIQLLWKEIRPSNPNLLAFTRHSSLRDESLLWELGTRRTKHKNGAWMNGENEKKWVCEWIARESWRKASEERMNEWQPNHGTSLIRKFGGQCHNKPDEPLGQDQSPRAFTSGGRFVPALILPPATETTTLSCDMRKMGFPSSSAA